MEQPAKARQALIAAKSNFINQKSVIFQIPNSKFQIPNKKSPPFLLRGFDSDKCYDDFCVSGVSSDCMVCVTGTFRCLTPKFFILLIIL